MGFPHRAPDQPGGGERLALSPLVFAAGRWAPLAGNAYHAGQIAVLYTGMLIASVALLRSRSAQRAIEPALALGALVVIGSAFRSAYCPGCFTSLAR